ncbi:MAG: hypothetical protein FJX89_08465 [Bacteroidetes bacterium]|nr:hypothetical protein [Bacteroidota bacterium]
MRRDVTVYDYVVVLRDTNRKATQRFGLLLSLLALLILAYRAYGIAESKASILFVVACAIFILRNALRMRAQQAIRHAPCLAVAGIGMIVVPPFFGIGLPFLALAWLESYASRKSEIGFSPQGIHFNGLGSRKYAWSEVKNVVLRDDLLTIDFRNNRLYQRYTDDEADEEYEVGEDDFNAFCRSQVNGTVTSSG